MGLRWPPGSRVPTAGFGFSSSSLLERGGPTEAQQSFWAMAFVKQIAASLQRMRKYPELFLVGQCEVGLLPSVIDYFRAVFQWSMTRPPWDTQIWAVETFLLLRTCQPCAVCQKRRGRRWQECKHVKRSNGYMAEKCDWNMKWWHSKVQPLAWSHLQHKIWHWLCCKVCCWESWVRTVEVGKEENS